jgi:hypothetical protein
LAKCDSWGHSVVSLLLLLQANLARVIFLLVCGIDTARSPVYTLVHFLPAPPNYISEYAISFRIAVG